jgi:hypothetical protein
MAAAIPASGRYPGAEQHPSANFWEGNNGRKAVTIHIAQGGYLSSVRHMEQKGLSSHLVNSLTGKMAQMVGFDDSALANGLSWDDTPGQWICPHGKVVEPTWALLKPGDPNPNTTTVSIENEGFSGRKQPAAQRASLERALEYLAGRYPSLNPYVVGTTLIGHYHLDPRDKGFCPGAGIDLAGIAAAVNKRLSAAQPQLWMQAWTARGVPLDPATIGWAIPQLYKFHFAELGACVRPEEYLVANEVSVAVFEQGLIYYVRRGDRTGYVRFPVPIVDAR